MLPVFMLLIKPKYPPGFCGYWDGACCPAGEFVPF